MIMPLKQFFGFALILTAAQVLAADDIVHLTKENFVEVINKADKPLIIDVSATWCKPCDAMKPHFQEFAQKNKAHYQCADVDYDESPEIVQGLSVSGLPCFVIINNKKPVGKVVGLLDAATLKTQIEEVIKNAGKKLSELSKEELNTRLQEAMQSCAVEEAAKIIDAGADVNYSFKEGVSPLVFAITFCCGRFGDEGLKMLQLLLDKGASTKPFSLPGMPMPISPKDLVNSMIGNVQQVVEQYKKILDVLDGKDVSTATKCTGNVCPVR